MRGDERDAVEMMREDMECGQNEQMNRMRGDSENDDVKCEVMKCDESENEKRRERYDEQNRIEEEMKK